MRDDEREFMLVDLLLGDVIEINKDLSRDMKRFCRKLDVPPIKDACKGMVQKSKLDGRTDSLTAPPLSAREAAAQGIGGAKYNTVQGYTQVDRRLHEDNPHNLPPGTWTRDPDCPRSQVWIVYENGRACERQRARGGLARLTPRCAGRPEVPCALLSWRVRPGASAVPEPRGGAGTLAGTADPHSA